MKKSIYLSFLALALSLSSAFAQHEPFLECHYTESYIDYPEKGKVKQDEMVLIISKGASEFYSLWCREHARLRDSLTAKGASLEEILAARDKVKYPVSTQHTVIYKNYPEKGRLTLTDQLIKSSFLYTEKMEIPQWEVFGEKKQIAGYDCQKAETNFLGRKWTAWFAPEIPVEDGPWKLCGLPGLILQAEDSEKEYRFTCIEIKNVSDAPAIRLPKKNYIKCSKSEYLKSLFLHKEDMNTFLRKHGIEPPVEITSNGKAVSAFPKRKFNYIERVTP